MPRLTAPLNGLELGGGFVQRVVIYLTFFIHKILRHKSLAQIQALCAFLN